MTFFEILDKFFLLPVTTAYTSDQCAPPHLDKVRQNTISALTTHLNLDNILREEKLIQNPVNYEFEQDDFFLVILPGVCETTLNSCSRPAKPKLVLEKGLLLLLQ